MIQDTQDRRVRRTRMRLQQAMLELLKEKDARSITVRELTQRADVNRGTFYAHYKDVFDLLDQMEQDLFQRLTQLLSSYSTQDLQRGLTPLLTDVFRFVRDDPVLRLAFLDQRTQDSFFRRLDQLIYKKCQEDWQGLFLPSRPAAVELLPGLFGVGRGRTGPGLDGTWFSGGAGAGGPTGQPADPERPFPVLSGNIFLNRCRFPPFAPCHFLGKRVEYF